MVEVDFLWVGEETSTGDAICIRFTDPSTNRPAVVVIDGGFTETGPRIVEHVRRHLGGHVDLVICTHPDDDHIRGLFAVIENLPVGCLLIHRPQLHGFSGDAFRAPLVEDLVAEARKRGVEVLEPFAGDLYFGGALTIVGPSEFDYSTFLAEQDRTPIPTARGAFLSAAAALGRALRSVFGDPGETLTGDNGGTSARNNTSVITNIAVEGKRLLLTGDAGAPALTAAANYMDGRGLSDTPLDFFQIPHHGSRHNLTRELCDRLLGRPIEGVDRGVAYVSVGKAAEEHPRPEVANACRRRGYPVYPTRGTNIWWHVDAPARSGYSSIQPLGWLDEET